MPFFLLFDFGDSDEGFNLLSFILAMGIVVTKEILPINVFLSTLVSLGDLGVKPIVDSFLGHVQRPDEREDGRRNE